MKQFALILACFTIVSVSSVFADEPAKVAATSYVSGAFDALNGSKQNKLQNDALVSADVSSTVKTAVSSSLSASDTALVTEKAVRDAVDVAGTVTDNGNGAIQAISGTGGGISVTRGDTQIVVKSGGNYSSTATMWIE